MFVMCLYCCYVFYYYDMGFFSLSILIVMYVPLCVLVFSLIVLLCVLFVCECVLDNCHRDIGALAAYPNRGFSVLFPQL
jgi:hypothetical protein